MKNTILILISLLLMFGCEESKKIEVIQNYDAEYTDVNLFSLFNKTGSPLINKENNLKIIGFMVDTTKEVTAYRIYVNKSGEIERVKIMHSGFSDIDKHNIKLIEDWNIQPIKVDNEIVNARFDIHLINYTLSGDKINEEIYFVAVEQMPTPIGGIKAIQEKIVYPEIAKRAGVEGRVFVKAFIDSTGKVVKTELLRGIGAGCDEAALNAVKNTMFKPGRQRGKPVNVQVTVPILFKLNGSSDNKKNSETQNKLISKEYIDFTHGGLAKLEGKIVSQKDGSPIVAANILLEGTKLGCSSDHMGEFFISKIPPGEYMLLVTSHSYGKQRLGKIKLISDKSLKAELKLTKKQ